MGKTKPTYPWSQAMARELGEAELWLESYRINCDCARFIEKQISANYADNRLNAQGVKAAIEKYGFDRVNRVLANTVTENKTDGRYSADNKKWAASFNIPREESRYNYNYSVNSHPGLVDVFINQARKEWANLNLYDYKNCYEDRTDYKGKVLAVRPDILKDEYKTPDNQLFYATGGFGCKEDSLGRKIYGVLLKDREECVFLRGEVIGAVKLELIPDWANEKVAEIRSKQEEIKMENLK